MARRKKIAGAAAARVAGVYGLGGAVPTYDEFVALWLNADDVLAARAFYDAVAALASAGEAIPDGWIAAAVNNPAEASRWRRWDLRRTNRR